MGKIVVVLSQVSSPIYMLYGDEGEA